MDIGTIGGVLLAFGLICAAVIMGGGSVLGMLDPGSIMIVVGGTIGAMIVAFPLAKVLKVHSVILKVVFTSPGDPVEILKELVGYAEIARREGILALENLTADIKEEFIVRGIKMAVDGTDPELIQEIMDTELEALMDRHGQGKMMLDNMGKYAPAFGMIGTLLGLIAMLNNMDDPSAIGPGMAVALITTLYGAIMANVVFGPVGDKLVSRSSDEVMIKTMIVTGVMSIQSGDNPRVVESKLMTLLPPSMRAAAASEAA